MPFFMFIWNTIVFTVCYPLMTYLLPLGTYRYFSRLLVRRGILTDEFIEWVVLTSQAVLRFMSHRDALS